MLFSRRINRLFENTNKEVEVYSMISRSLFGKTSNGENVYLYELNNSYLRLKASAYGAAIVALIVKDRKNNDCDVVLGYDNVISYEQQNSYIGCIVGRCCNRIKNAEFVLMGKKYILSRNEGHNHLHGGFSGFNKKLWQANILDDNSLKLTYISADKEEGYPGRLVVSVIYTIRKNKLFIDYEAKSTKDTICNLTNHTYFNLNGYNEGNMLDNEIQIFADEFSEDGKDFLPTGRILPVMNTPMDLRKKQFIGKNIASEYYQIKNANGYNVNYIIKKRKNSHIVHFATAYSVKSGIILKAYTDMPCCEFYTSSYLDGNAVGKDNVPIRNYSGFCLEPQFAPNAVNMPMFIKPILKRNKNYKSRTIYELIVKK